MTTLSKHTTSASRSDEEGDGRREHQEADESMFLSKIVIGATALGVLALIAGPWVLQQLYGPLPKPRQLGTVQQVRFVGGLGLHTQIDTDTGSYLVRGAVELRPGALLELRQRYFDAWVCEVGSQACRELVSR